MDYVIGLDLGTSSIKGLVLDQNGEVILSATENYPLHNPKSGYSEQNPEDWVNGAINVLETLIAAKPVLKTNLKGISVAGQMHSLVLLDQADKVLRPAILWNDVRTTAEVTKIMKEYGQEILATTKNIALEGFTLPKLLWVKKNEPEIWQEVSSFLLPKDYLIYSLTGHKQIEYSDAAGTLLLNLETRNWNEKISQQFQIPLEYYPKLVHSMEYVGEINQVLSEKLGIEIPVKVFAGGADNACAALGAGIVTEKQAMLSIGTSGVFLSYEGETIKDYSGKLHYFNHVLPASYYSMGVTLAAGESLRWFRNLFSERLNYDELLNSLGDVPVGSRGLLFTPFINGERTPYVDSDIRGSFLGLDSCHTQADLTRAVVEGITFSLKECQQIMEKEGQKEFSEIISVGGGAKSKTWLQIQADIFNLPVRSLKAEEGPGLGAGMIAALGVGWFDSIEECVERFVSYTDFVYPITENVETYEQLFKIYQQVYAQTATISAKLVKFR